LNDVDLKELVAYWKRLGVTEDYVVEDICFFLK
jgi:hypothetical protein